MTDDPFAFRSLADGWLPLAPHPAHPPGAAIAVLARYYEGDDQRWTVQFRVEGELGRVRGLDAPAAAPVDAAATDGLWRATCFELFVADADGAGYAEYNYAPGGQWAAYRFTDYRQRAAPVAGRPRAMQHRVDPSGFHLFVDPGMYRLAGRRIGLSAVMAGANGTLSYWALAHPPGGGAPDFHHRACFALALPAAPGS